MLSFSSKLKGGSGYCYNSLWNVKSDSNYVHLKRNFSNSGGFVKVARESLNPKKLEDFARRRGSNAHKLGEDAKDPKNLKSQHPSHRGAYIPEDLYQERYTRPERSWHETLDFHDTQGIPDEDMDMGGLPKARLPVMPEPREQIIKHKPDGSWYATAFGSRKRATCRVMLRPGTGNVKINGRTLMDYFRIILAREHALEPFLITEKLGQYDVVAKIEGGGWMGMEDSSQFYLCSI
jgi:hypothetical protein